jgi:hypothetical protein
MSASRSLGKVPGVREPMWTWFAKLGEYGELDRRLSILYMAKPSSRYLLVADDRHE